MSPTADSFRALARSSPWLWRTLTFTLEFEPPRSGSPSPLRAFVRRPQGVRVEDLHGAVIQASWRAPAAAGLPELPGAPEVRSEDGLIAHRPGLGRGDDPYRYDDPMFVDYRWVAMLHPFEVADGVGRDEEDGQQTDGWSPDRSPIELLDGPREVDHFGRPAWEAVVTTTVSYAARCSCCPLLDGRQAALQLSSEGWVRDPIDLPQSWLLRLDRETGVVVRLAEIDGHGPGGWTMRIENVDTELPRELFGDPMPGQATFSRFLVLDE